MLWVGLIDELWDQLGGLVSPKREPWLFAASASMGEARARTFVTGRALLKYALIELGALGAHDALPQRGPDGPRAWSRAARRRPRALLP